MNLLVAAPSSKIPFVRTHLDGHTIFNSDKGIGRRSCKKEAYIDVGVGILSTGLYQIFGKVTLREHEISQKSNNLGTCWWGPGL